MTKYEWALYLASLGFHVFPIFWDDKTPLIDSFPTRASMDPEQIKVWWIRFPNANIGISTTRFREKESLLVIDEDNKEEKMGHSELIKLELTGVDIPITCEQTTPTGGRHYIYSVPEPVKQGVNVFGHGLDTRGKGGYIVGAGSDIGGRKYEITVREVCPAPEWMVLKCGRPTTKSDGASEPMPSSIDQENAKSRARHYLEIESPESLQGARNDTCYKVACKLRDFGLQKINALELMSEVYNFRKCFPPFSEDDLAKVVSNAYKYAANAPGILATETIFTPITEVEGEKHEDIKDPNQKSKFPRERFHAINPSSGHTYLVEKLLDPGTMSVVYGESNSGKTFFCLDMALFISLGQTWHDHRVKKGLVIYVAAEGGWAIKKRIKAFRQYHKLEERNDVPFYLVPCSINLLDPKADAAEIVKLIKECEIESGEKAALVVIDTLSRAMGGGNENAPNDMGDFVRNVDRIREATKAHLMLIHHSGKDVARGARGHSSLRAATDTEIEVAGYVAKTKKQRDMEFGRDIGFKLEQVQIGVNEDGEPLYSCVVLPSNTSATADLSKEHLDVGTLKGKGFRALQNAMDWKAIPAPNDLDLDGDAIVVTIDDWRHAFFELVYTGIKPPRSSFVSFTRVVKQLTESGHIKHNDLYAWI